MTFTRRFLTEHAVKKDSLVQAAFDHDVPIFCPAFTDSSFEQMVYAEATSVLPLLASYAWHRGNWKKRKQLRFAKLFTN